MRAAVTKRFRDRLNLDDVYEIGSVFEGDAERIAELVAGGWVKEIAEEEPPDEKPAPRKRTRKPKQ